MSAHVSLRDGSSSEEDSRPELERTMDGRKTQVTRHHHPFSVEAIMSGRKIHSEFTSKPDNVSVVPFSKTQNSPYLCRESYSPPAGIRKHFIPPSPVKSESSEPEDCAPWVMSPRFSAQTRKSFFGENLWFLSRLIGTHLEGVLLTSLFPITYYFYI